MTILYALASVFVFGLAVGIIIGVPLGTRLRVNHAINNTPEAVAHVRSLLDDVHRDLDGIHGDVPRIPFQGSVR